VDSFILGSARASRAVPGAPSGHTRPKQHGQKVRNGEGAIASTRGRVRSPLQFAIATILMLSRSSEAR